LSRLFGTDGARGIANTELTCELAMQIGRAAAVILTERTQRRSRILIGKDTRASSDMLEAALIAGIASVGADSHLAGVIPTPAVSYLIGKYGFDAGIMISASHNPCEWNGIKLFDRDGFKLPDTLEDEIEALVKNGIEGVPQPIGADLGRVIHEDTATVDYTEHIRLCIDEPLDDLRIALDCANGSAAKTAHSLFSSMGAECFMLSARPDGANINDRCGSTHMENLVEFVKEHKLYGGLAFDGDADRCLAVDENGDILDGDKIIAVCAMDLKRRGKLNGSAAVVTVMSNLGFFKFASENGISTAATKVGDRYVLEEMLQKGYTVGGEQSGHVIFLDYAKTGDGQLTGAMLLAAAKRAGRPLSELGRVMETYPQTLVNIKVSDEIRVGWESDEAIAAAIASAKSQLGEEGRVLVRASGTEPLIRIMIEGKELPQIETLAQQIAKEFRRKC
jgi:phosphoglucosamine mutase